jgi:hypothetical protein
MRKRLFLVTALIAALSGYGIGVYAAQTPTGPYQKSCTKCSVNGKMGPAGKLFCTCTKRNGAKQNASLLLDPKNTAPIYNCDGNLQYGACR